jgi:segregation and condensation protein A
LEKNLINDIILAEFKEKMHKITLEQFEGPLDLLLQLIEKNKLQITEISLAKITDQYLTLIEGADNLVSEEVADFLLIASRLIYIKSKYLLPDLALETDDDTASLEKQLKIYRQYFEASKAINKLYNNKHRHSWSRQQAMKLPVKQEFVAPLSTNINILNSIFVDVLGRIERFVNIPKVVMQKAISIGEKILHLKEFIKDKLEVKFSHLVTDSNNKMETIVSFLAMLELIKQREIMAEQDNMFGEINIVVKSEK